MSKFTRAARNEPCTLCVPGMCNGDPETTVFCHAPSPDKGMGFKSPDWWGAFGCSDCHDFIDGRVRGIAWDEPKEDIWLRGIYRTQKRFRELGLM